VVVAASDRLQAPQLSFEKYVCQVITDATLGAALIVDCTNEIVRNYQSDDCIIRTHQYQRQVKASSPPPSVPLISKPVPY
jgi:hypothetical protein